MTRQFQTGSRIGVLTLFFATLAVHADIVHLRDGQVLENVRTELRGGTLVVSPPGGAVQRIPVDRILRIEPAPVRTPSASVARETQPASAAAPVSTQSPVAVHSPANRERAFAGRETAGPRALASVAARSPLVASNAASALETAPATASPAQIFEEAAPVDRDVPDAGDTETAEDSSANSAPSRGRLFFEGLAPGWSGLHHRGDAAGYAGGALLGALELYLAYYAAVFQRTPVTAGSGGAFAGDSRHYLESAAYAVAAIPLNNAAPNLGTVLNLNHWVRQNDLVRHPLDGNRWITHRDFHKIRSNYTGALAATLLLDGVLSAIYGLPQGASGAGITPRYDGVDVAFTLKF